MMAARSAQGQVHAVALSKTHVFSKDTAEAITLVQDYGVEGDCHSGATVQHRSRLKLKPLPPNLRQVHLIARETLESASQATGMTQAIEPGQLGENITTGGIDLCRLSKDTRLVFHQRGDRSDEPLSDSEAAGSGASPAIVRVTGLRNPCPQIDNFHDGLKDQFLVRDAAGAIVGRTIGIMAVVERGGVVKTGMTIEVQEPDVHEELKCV